MNNVISIKNLLNIIYKNKCIYYCEENNCDDALSQLISILKDGQDAVFSIELTGGVNTFYTYCKQNNSWYIFKNKDEYNFTLGKKHYFNKDQLFQLSTVI